MCKNVVASNVMEPPSTYLRSLWCVCVSYACVCVGCMCVVSEAMLVNVGVNVEAHTHRYWQAADSHFNRTIIAQSDDTSL
jgi:hypothetical protein